MLHMPETLEPLCIRNPPVGLSLLLTMVLDATPQETLFSKGLSSWIFLPATWIKRRILFTKPRCAATGMRLEIAAMAALASLLMVKRNSALLLVTGNGRPRLAWPGFTGVALTAVGAAMLVSAYKL